MVIYEILKGLGQSFVLSANQQTGLVIWSPANTQKKHITRFTFQPQDDI